MHGVRHSQRAPENDPIQAEIMPHPGKTCSDASDNAAD